MALSALTFDAETTGLCRHLGDRMFAFSTGDEQGNTEVHRFDGNMDSRGRACARMEEIWQDPKYSKVPKIMHNAKFDVGFAQTFLGDETLWDSNVVHDTFLMSHLLQNNHPAHRLKDLCWELASFPRDDEREIKNYMRVTDTDYSQVPASMMEKYQRADAQRTMLLYLFFWPKIKEHGFEEIYRTEIDLLRTTSRMEKRGIMIVPERVEALLDNLETDIASIQDTLRERSGIPDLSVTRPADVRRLLFDHLKLEPVSRTGTGLASTKKADIIELFENETDLQKKKTLDLLLQSSSYRYSFGTIQGYLQYVDANDIIHPDIKTNGAVTGRESCSRPNLQNVEREGVLLNRHPVLARKVFRPKPGFVNFHIDYSGIEMRLLVHYSKDREMIGIMNRGEDPHNAATEIFYGKRYLEALEDEPTVAKALRSAGKNANFAIPYGAAPSKIATTLALKQKEADRVFKEYTRRFPQLVGLSRRIAEEVRLKGYVKTTFGRRLFVQRDKGYMGTNYLIQGTAGEILKRAQIRVDRYLQKATGDEAGIILPIHDEIIIEYPRDRLEDAPEILKGIRDRMVDFDQFDIPMEVEVQVGTSSWSNLEEW